MKKFVNGLDGLDPLSEVPLFHATAEESFCGDKITFGEPVVFWLQSLGGFVRNRRGETNFVVPQAPVISSYRAFLERLYGAQWEVQILSGVGEVCLFELRAIFVRYLWLMQGQKEEFVLVKENWPQKAFRAQLRSLARGWSE